uniref:Uncharacterized protein n=1 Tax=Anguilla anguilla TaxID=7936 RepID=A0A0E9XTS6_ANGAN
MQKPNHNSERWAFGNVICMSFLVLMDVL